MSANKEYFEGPLRQMTKDCADRLSEHFDSVRIFVTLHDSEAGVTRSYETGAGNFHAQFGQVKEWVGIQEQYSREWAKRKDAESNEGDGDR